MKSWTPIFLLSPNQVSSLALCPIPSAHLAVHAYSSGVHATTQRVFTFLPASSAHALRIAAGGSLTVLAVVHARGIIRRRNAADSP